MGLINPNSDPCSVHDFDLSKQFNTPLLFSPFQYIFVINCIQDIVQQITNWVDYLSTIRTRFLIIKYLIQLSSTLPYQYPPRSLLSCSICNFSIFSSSSILDVAYWKGELIKTLMLKTINQHFITVGHHLHSCHKNPVCINK